MEKAAIKSLAPIFGTIFLIILINLLVGCGSPAPTMEEQSASNKSIRSTEEKKGQEPMSTAMLVGSIKGMPICSIDLEGQLIYVKDESQFYFCSEDVWEQITLKGSNGKDGANGKDGEKGLDGINGKDGQNGIDGVDGETVVKAPVDAYSWYHPVSGDKWFVGNTITAVHYSGNTPNLLDDNYICPTGSRSPTEDEYLDALSAGIWYKFSSYAPLLIRLGEVYSSMPYQYGPQSLWGTQSHYALRVGNNSSGINNLSPSPTVSYVSAKALCVVN